MNKKGAGSDMVNQIIGVVLTIILILTLISILWTLFGILFVKEKFSDMGNFNRVVEELNFLSEKKIDTKTCEVLPDIRKVPIVFEKDRPHTIMIYSGNDPSTPPVCGNKNCICIFHKKEKDKGDSTQYCEILDQKNLENLNVDTNTILITDKTKYLTITRNCDKLTLA